MNIELGGLFFGNVKNDSLLFLWFFFHTSLETFGFFLIFNLLFF